MENAQDAENTEGNGLTDRDACFAGPCHVDDSSDADGEAAADPFLCPFLGPPGPVYLKGSVCGSDPFEACHAGRWSSYPSPVSWEISGSANSLP